MGEEQKNCIECGEVYNELFIDSHIDVNSIIYYWYADTCEHTQFHRITSSKYGGLTLNAQAKFKRRR